MIDNNAFNPPGVTERLAADSIRGFSNKNFFEAIFTGDPTTFSVVEANLNTALPTSVTPAVVRSIIFAHGY